MNLNIVVGKKSMNFEKLSALHVSDLFEGTANAPANSCRRAPDGRHRPTLKVKAGPHRPVKRRIYVDEPVEKIDPPKSYDKIPCPCCQQRVETPSLDVIIDHYSLTPLQARILGAAWRGKGMPVQTERIFDAMYVDDPDGGPSYTLMYKSFKVALCRLRMRLKGSGVSIKNVGYGRGYRLVLGDN